MELDDAVRTLRRVSKQMREVVRGEHDDRFAGRGPYFRGDDGLTDLEAAGVIGLIVARSIDKVLLELKRRPANPTVARPR